MQRLLMNDAELQIVFNLLDDRLTIEYPLYDFDLFVAKPVHEYFEFDTRGKKRGSMNLSHYILNVSRNFLTTTIMLIVC